MKRVSTPYRAITTTFLPPTNHRGARLKAYDSQGNALIVTRPESVDEAEGHALLALVFVHKMEWKADELITAWRAPGEYVHILLDEEKKP